MRVLRVAIEGAKLFKDARMRMYLFATGRVGRQEGGTATADVTQAGTGTSTYSQNVVAIYGANASGKTTTLNLLQLALDVLAGEEIGRGFDERGLTIGKVGARLGLTVTFWHRGAFYLLESRLERDGRSSHLGPSSPLGLRFVDEAIWRLVGHRVNRRMIADPAAFRRGAVGVLRRRADSVLSDADAPALTDSELRLLGNGRSIVSVVIGSEAARVSSLERGLPMQAFSIPVVRAFDPSVERLDWDSQSEVYTLKFTGERERVVDCSVAASLPSRGTVFGVELITRALEVLGCGGYLLVDEIEEAIDRFHVATLIDLFATPVTNPHGARLVFTAHCPETLDVLHRKDNVYLLVRGDDGRTDAVRYSDCVRRAENKKSEVVRSGLIQGTMPRYPDVRGMRDYVRSYVDGQAWRGGELVSTHHVVPYVWESMRAA